MFEKPKALFMLIAAAIIAAVLLWPAPDDAPLELALQVQKTPADSHSAISQTSQIPKIKKVLTPEQKKPLASVSVEQGMQHEMQRVADIYQQRSQYAPYSLYLSAAQTDLIHPNQSHESPRAYDIDGVSVSILIKPKNYRFSTAEKVAVGVQVQSTAEGLQSINNLSIDLVATTSKEHWPMTIVQSEEKDGIRRLQAEFDLSSQVASLKEENYSIRVSASFNGEAPVKQSAPIKIVSSIAKIIGLGVIRVEHNDLIIPIYVEADKSGYYQVSASLFNAPSNSAVSFLITKGRLSRGSNTLEAKVQGLVLRDKGFSGPFRLQGITLVKKSERPGMAEEYGTSAEHYDVNAIDLDDFESIPYEDPLTQQRLEFLRSIAQ